MDTQLLLLRNMYEDLHIIFYTHITRCTPCTNESLDALKQHVFVENLEEIC